MIRLTRAAAAFLLLCFGQPAEAGPVSRRIYPAPTAPLSVSGLPAGTELVRVRTGDGLELTGLAVPARPGRPTLLVFHGNGSSAADSVRWLQPLAAQGFGLIAAEYRGYSGNPGEPDEAGLTADAEAFLALARPRAAGGPVWVVGHSLGAGVAFDLARRERLEALVTVGAFTRLRAMAPKLARAFVPDGYDNLAAVPALDEPWFLIHGSADSTVPLQMGEALHKAAGAAHRRGASFVVMGADHKPDGATMAAILACVAAHLAGAPLSPAGLPEAVKLVPFGQTRSLDR
jgi:pimeloyl-ACP methyl ester carboxylesterase